MLPHPLPPTLPYPKIDRDRDRIGIGNLFIPRPLLHRNLPLILFPIVNLLSMQYETNLVPDQPNDSKGLADRSS